MVFKIGKGDTRPVCANPSCRSPAIIMVGIRFFCGPCAQKAMSYKRELEDAYIMEKFREDAKK